jgi:signal transduction histidine kinase
MTNHALAADIRAVQSIGAVPTIMRVIAETTGMRWVCVSRVTNDAWTMCAVRDELGFGLKPGDGIDIANTFCDQVRKHNVGVVIDDVANDDAYVDHPIPKLFGFSSYFSLPVYRADGSFFGTLCGLDPNPAQLRTPKTLDTLKLFAELLSGQIDAEQRLSDVETALLQERENAELREQFIAVLGHDLRTPLSSMLLGTETIAHLSTDEKITAVASRIARSGRRIASLVDDVLDFTHGKMGGALPVDRQRTNELADALQHVVAELSAAHAGRTIETAIAFDGPVFCDPRRIAQLLSNLVVNAILHGSPDTPVLVRAGDGGGTLTISVSNAGTPIPRDTAARLFRPFWRGEGASKSGGLGLGLYIASEIARSHDGAITVESNDERTVFTLTVAAT